MYKRLTDLGLIVIFFAKIKKYIWRRGLRKMRRVILPRMEGWDLVRGILPRGGMAGGMGREEGQDMCLGGGII